MISGAMRGKGEGDALARHLTKPENDEVVVIPARGLGSPDVRGQIRELVAMSLGGRTDQPIYHLHVDPEDGIADNAGARRRWWALFEAEFGLTGQPYCGVEHFKKDRRHEHRVYSLVRPSGAVVDLRHDFARREKIGRIVEYEFGVPAVRSKHARSIERALREDGRHDVADWLLASGTLETERPVARVTPQERLIEERTGLSLDYLRAAALEAWRESADGVGFLEALRRRGLDLREGRSGPVVVDSTGTPHLATRLIGAAARRADGTRIPAGVVRDRLAGLTLAAHGDGHGQQVGRDHRGADHHPAVAGGPRDGAGAGRDAGGAVPHRGPVGAHDGGGRSGRGGVEPALARLEARPGDARLRARLRMALSGSRGEEFRFQVEEVRTRNWVAVPGMNLDIWGLPIQGERPRLG